MNSLLSKNCRSIPLIIVGILLFLASPTLAQQNTLSQATSYATQAKNTTSTGYNPSFGRLSLQFGSGLLYGSIGGLAGGFTGILIFAPRSDGSGAGFAAMGIGLLGAATGYIAGSALGVHQIANTQMYDASFGTILLGNTLGAAAGIGTLVLSAGTFGKGTPMVISLGVALSTTVIGGMIANNLSIDKRKKKASALLNISDEETTLSTPSLKVTKVGNHNLPEIVNRYAPTVKLLNISL